jgi:hypothetical protein
MIRFARDPLYRRHRFPTAAHRLRALPKRKKTRSSLRIADMANENGRASRPAVSLG